MKVKNNFDKLDPYLNRANLQQVQQGVGSANSVQSGEVKKAGDVVHLSSRDLKNTAVNEAIRTPELRQEKVDAIKAKISDGSYSINSKDIAGKILQMETDIFS